MRAFNIFIIILSTLLLLALGGILLATALSSEARGAVLESWNWYQTLVASSSYGRMVSAALGGVVMVLAASTIFGNLRNRRYERAVVFHNPHGEVMIALGALEDLGKAVRSEINGVKDIKMRVKARRRGLQVTARVTLWSDANLPKTTELIQESVRSYLQEVVGSEQEIRPRVVVSKVAWRDPADYEEEEDFRPRRLRKPMV